MIAKAVLLFIFPENGKLFRETNLILFEYPQWFFTCIVGT